MLKRSAQQGPSLEQLDTDYVCGLCREVYESKDDLQEHQEEVHGRKEIEKDDSGEIWGLNR